MLNKIFSAVMISSSELKRTSNHHCGGEIFEHVFSTDMACNMLKHLSSTVMIK